MSKVTSRNEESKSAKLSTHESSITNEPRDWIDNKEAKPTFPIHLKYSTVAIDRQLALNLIGIKVTYKI